MAQLTLSQKSTMANSLTFQRRLVSAVKATANYWANYTIDTFEKYSVANKKKKEFAKLILGQASIPNPQAYAEYLLNQYTDANPSLNADGELDDQILSDSSASSYTYDYFSGVQPGDDTKQVTF